MSHDSQAAQPSQRSRIVVGNWKMYKTIEEACTFIETVSPLIAKSQVTVYLAVPFTAIYPAVKKVRELHAPLVIGAQNMNDATEGAFTGEIAARMLQEAGASFVILGHSERRQLFHETDAWINKKVKRALTQGIQPLLCVGETGQEREEKLTESVLKKQILASLKGVKAEEIERLILAYEPVWAIGTGISATVADAQAAHSFCREVVREKWGVKCADSLRILYGGSVKSENASSLIREKDIDGLLVGGAALSPDSFSEIINSIP